MVSAEQLSAFRTCVDDILTSLGKFLADLTDAPSREVGDAQASMDVQLQHFFKVYYALRQRHDEATLSAAILALTKSGKSTLLNAIMGRECLPMNNVPETARLCKIEHSQDAEPRMLERGTEYHGDVEIRRRLQEINSEVRAREYLPQDDQMLHIFTPVAFFTGQNDSGTKFFLLDTPGPNEAGEEGLRYQVERLLDGVDAVIYLLDYTKLKTAEEAAIFTRLKQINPVLVRRLSQRLFFVVNKADQLRECDGLDEQDTKEYVAQLVTQQLAFEGFQLTPDQVILLSARNALSARLVLSGQPPSERFYRQVFGSRWQKLLPTLTQADVEAEALDMLDQSGIRELEERVLGFLYSHSASLKILAVIDDIARLLQEVWNVTESCRAALAKNVEELQSQTEDMRLQLQDTLKEFESTMHSAEALHSEVTDEIRQHLDNLRTKLFNYIMQTLEPEIQGAATPVAGKPQSSRWKSIRDKFLGLFGAGRSASRSKDELASLLIELHEDLLAQISNEVSEFWHILEGCTSMRHMQLISSINQQLKQLSGRVEHIVSEALNVELEAVQISLQMPSAEQFHSDLQQLITRGIAEKTERHIRVGQRKYEERVMRFRQGLCRLGTYWESVPRTRTVVETYNVTVFQVQPSEILNHFIHMVDSAVDSTGSVLNAYVKQFMNDQLDQAREKITTYADRYLKAMSSALESSSAGETARKQALTQVAGRLSQVEELRGAVSELQGKVESCVPQHDYEEVDFELMELLMEQQREEQRKEVDAAKAGLATLATATPVAAADASTSSVAGPSVYEQLLKEVGLVNAPPTASTTPQEATTPEGPIPAQADDTVVTMDVEPADLAEGESADQAAVAEASLTHADTDSLATGHQGEDAGGLESDEPSAVTAESTEGECVFDDASSVVMVPDTVEGQDTLQSDGSVEVEAQARPADNAAVGTEMEAGQQQVEAAPEVADDNPEQEDDTVLFVDTPEPYASEQVVVDQGAEAAVPHLSQKSEVTESGDVTATQSDAATLGSDFGTMESAASEEQTLEGDVPTLGSDGEVALHLAKLDNAADEVLAPTSPALFHPVIEVAADYSTLAPPSPTAPQTPPAPALPTSVPPSHPPLSPPFPAAPAATTAQQDPAPGIPPATGPQAPLPVVDAAHVAGETENDGDGFRSCYEEPEYDSVQREDVPFDYQREMFAVMSTSHVAPPASPGSPTSDDEWLVVEDA